MQLKEHYTNMWNEAFHHFERNMFEYDTLIDSVKDYRFGVTLIAKPSIETQLEITKMLNDLRQTEPDQYYYPLDDVHVTILSIISCYDGFKLSNINTDAYIDVIRKSLKNIHSFPIMFEGITASPACIMIQGYAGDEIEKIRNNLRDNFKNCNLETSIDKRYQIHTAHSTVVRFRHPIKNSNAFLEKIKQYRHHYFGTTEVQELEFVFNDWYQRHLDEHILARFKLPLYY
ncbi:mutarotase [Panacibacter ginsenosidivorans]|uniref:Mutarotase n=1 Tax=Panacibacter ginsenosidivorans TaxID=1813871 RepID=A0A5B8V976_9BACT|nr:mutarotase [Panacibacter ginsenosidivorans]QEC67401.1 mutarotase [Panacibacter ginsenosidivorans]